MAMKRKARAGRSTTAPVIDTDVLIVGGGLAGITTAVGLKDAGLDILLVEKSDVLGGRARSWQDPATGDPVHVGPHIFMNSYPNMFRLLDLCGTRDQVTWQAPGHFITQVDGQHEIDIVANPRLPAPASGSAS